ncbi:MAG: ABC transporter substrate-binding protein [Desulfobulbus sp.]
MKILNTLLWFCLLIPVVLGLPAVGVQAGETPVLRFAYQDRIGSVLPLIAVHNGLFAEEGVRIKPLRFSNGPACAEALYTGAADIGAMGDTAAIIMTVRSPNFVIIGSHATGEHRHRIMIRKNAALRTLVDLKGKRIGVKKGTSTHGGLLAALDKAGISPEAVTLVDLPPSTMVDALQAGSIDAFAASEPTPTVAEQRGARQLLTLGGLGNDYPILLLADRKVTQRDPSLMRGFIRALRKAQQFAQEHPEETAALVAKETGLPLEATRRAMQRHTFRLCLDQPVVESLQQTARFLVGQHLIDHGPDWAVVLDRDYVE